MLFCRFKESPQAWLSFFLSFAQVADPAPIHLCLIGKETLRSITIIFWDQAMQ